MSKRVWIWGIGGYLILRWILGTLPGYVVDVLAYKRWLIHLGRSGITQIYKVSDFDYPPLYAYFLAPLGKLYGWMAPEALANFGDSTVLTLMVKLWPMAFDLAVAWTLYRIGRRLAPRPGRFQWSAILPAVYLLNPAVLYNNGYGGQPDSVLCFFVLTAFLAISRPAAVETRERGTRALAGSWPAWVLLTLAVCMKPLGAPYFPLLFVLSLLRYGIASTAWGVGAFAGTLALVFLPFLLSGQMAQFLHLLGSDAVKMAYTSVNANNLWWVLGSWKDSEVPILGPFTATQLGLSAFGIVYLLLLWKAYVLHRRQPGGLRVSQVLALAVAVGFSFFMLSTKLHENHLISVLPLLILLIPAGRNWRGICALLSLGIFLNCMLHDPVVSRHFTLGGPTGLVNHTVNRPFFLAEITAIWVAALVNVGTYFVFLLGIFGLGWLDALGQPPTDVAPALNDVRADQGGA